MSNAVKAILMVLLFSVFHVLTLGAKNNEDVMSDKRSTTDAKGKTTTVVKAFSATSTTTGSVVLASHSFAGSVTIHGQGGATLAMILANLKADQTPQHHADVWIIEGGINDIKWFAGYDDAGDLWAEYFFNLCQIASYAQACGAKLYFQELTPVVAAMINQDPYWAGLDVPDKIPVMNAMIHQIAGIDGWRVVDVYDAFAPHWVDWNNGGSAVHPNATGTLMLAAAWAKGIKGDVSKNTSIYVAGDSIANTVSSDLLLAEIVANFPSAAEAWCGYE